MYVPNVASATLLPFIVRRSWFRRRRPCRQLGLEPFELDAGVVVADGAAVRLRPGPAGQEVQLGAEELRLDVRAVQGVGLRARDQPGDDRADHIGWRAPVAPAE